MEPPPPRPPLGGVPGPGCFSGGHKSGKSDLRKAALTSAALHAPPIPRFDGLAPMAEDTEEGEGSPGGIPLHFLSATPAGPLGSGGAHAASTAPGPQPWAMGALAPSSGRSAGAYAPEPRGRGQVVLSTWNKYWDEKKQIHLPGRGGTFNVYFAGATGPVVLCVHGGGYTGLTWSLVAQKLKHKYRVLAPDMRGHGETSTDQDGDYSKETMSLDIVELWEHLYGPAATAAAAAATSATAADGAGAVASTSGAPAAPPAASPSAPAAAPGRVPTVLVGHSMGGGLVVWAAATKRITSLEGVVVIDVVEGTALSALPHMAGIVHSRPTSFASPEDAVSWALRTGMGRNKAAAGVSIPSQLRQASEAQQQQQAEPGAAAAAGRGLWVWRTPLMATQPYWEGWYTGLSDAFLGQLTGPKMLLLAGTDRLDKQLTIGQMQGKFQLVLMPTAGHAIQEDEPDKTAEHLLGFLTRFRVGEPPLQFPRAPLGTQPMLPVVAGPFHQRPTGAGPLPGQGVGTVAPPPSVPGAAAPPPA